MLEESDDLLASNIDLNSPKHKTESLHQNHVDSPFLPRSNSNSLVGSEDPPKGGFPT
jgi:hypothetical protein